MAYEKRAYEVVERDRAFEIREYPAAVVAETRVEGDFEDVGSKAFRVLVAYISGQNEARQSIAMTAPVTQESSPGGYRVTFTMPSGYALETLPAPRDEKIRLRPEPAQRFATVRYSGIWSRSRYERHLSELRRWLAQRGLEPKGAPVWARYDPPFMPWFLRRNEILIPIGE